MPFAPVRFAAREGEGEGRTGFTRFLRRKRAPAIVSAGNPGPETRQHPDWTRKPERAESA
jgi:hypothetical protein